MGWKKLFEFGWFKLVIALILTVIFNKLSSNYLRIGSDNLISIFSLSDFFSLLAVLSFIYFVIIGVSGILKIIKSKIRKEDKEKINGRKNNGEK